MRKPISFMEMGRPGDEAAAISMTRVIAGLMIAIAGCCAVAVNTHAQRTRKVSPGHQRSKGKHQLGVDGYDIQADDSRGAWGIA